MWPWPKLCLAKLLPTAVSTISDGPIFLFDKYNSFIVTIKQLLCIHYFNKQARVILKLLMAHAVDTFELLEPAKEYGANRKCCNCKECFPLCPT